MGRLQEPMYGIIKPKDSADVGEVRKHFVAAAGEFVGTFLFLFTAFLGHAMSVQTAPNESPTGGNSNQTVIYISISYGFSLLVAAWILYRVSGGLFNPAVTLGMVLTGSLPPIRGLVLVPAQILGAICAAAVVSCIIPVDIAIVQTKLGAGLNPAQGVFLEMVRAQQASVVQYVLANMITVPNRRTHLHHPHARGREEQRHLHCSHRHRPLSLRRRSRRRKLHRSISQPRPLFRALCSRRLLPTRTLDLLGRALPRCSPRRWLLQLHQIHELRRRKPRTGFRWRG
jgi:hypothetical protein